MLQTLICLFFAIETNQCDNFAAENILADKLNGIIISEVLADNAGGAAIDTDGDGNTNKSDEFIELQNTTNSTLTLDGYEIWSEKNGLLYSFGASDTIASGDTATVVGNYTGTPPTGYYDGGVSEGTNWIPDGEGQKFDSIFLVDTATGEYIVLSYGNPPQSPTLPTGFPGTTQLGAGETIDSNAPNGTAFARDANGTFTETTPTPGTPGVPCFLQGTGVLTEDGAVLVENLRPGMRLLTKDAGYVPLRGVGCFALTDFEMRRHPSLMPVIFPKGSIGNTRDLLVSGSHRMLVEDAIAEMLFGEAEVLASARSFIGHNGICVAPKGKPPIYFHLLFERHEIILVEGSWVESLFLADLGMRALENAESWKFSADFDQSDIEHTQTARLVLKRYEAELLFATNDRFTVSHSEAA